MSHIWCFIMIVSLISISISGGGDAVSSVLNSSIEKAFNLFITLTPIMCFWSGIMEVAQRCGISEKISHLLSPLISILFGKEYKKSDVAKKIAMNMSANIFGMGNAATPLGIDAMKSLNELNSDPFRADSAMCMLVVVNTASIQLIPTTVIALRSQYGSMAPSNIMLPTIITTLAAFFVGTCSAKIIERFWP